MIAFVEGTVRLIRQETIVLDVQGVGYELYVSRPEAQKSAVRFFIIRTNMSGKMPFFFLALKKKKIMKFSCV